MRRSTATYLRETGSPPTAAKDLAPLPATPPLLRLDRFLCSLPVRAVLDKLVSPPVLADAVLSPSPGSSPTVAQGCLSFLSVEDGAD